MTLLERLLPALLLTIAVTTMPAVCRAATPQTDKSELKAKVRALVKIRFAGQYDAAFRHYAGMNDSPTHLERGELIELLEDADVGNRLTRGVLASRLLQQLDKNKDGKLSPDELRAAGKLFDPPRREG